MGMAPGSGSGNDRLRAALRERNLTAEQFAEAVNAHGRDHQRAELRCSDRLVRKWLSGAVARPQQRYAVAIEGVLGCPVEVVGLLSRRRTGQRALAGRADREGHDPVERRDFLLEPLALVALGVPDMMAGPDGDALAGRLHEVTRTLQASGDLVGGGALYEAAVRQIKVAQAALRQARWRSATERAVLRGTGELAALAGWFAFDCRQYSAAERWYDRALRLARVTADPMLEARAFASLSMVARTDERYSEAITVARCAQRAARELASDSQSDHLHSLLHARIALAFSRLGERAQAERHIEAAWSALTAANGAPPQWLAFFDATELRSLTAATHADLRRYPDAVRQAEQAVLGYSDAFTRNRAYCLARLAAYYVRMREPTQAAAVGSALVAMAPQMTSAYVRNLLREFRDEVKPYAKVPAIRDFLDGYRSMNGRYEEEKWPRERA
jgi:tetratricopeptide (TPR) repeat protein